jgi:hypothetical protein
VLVGVLHVNKHDNSIITQRVKGLYCVKEELIG